METRRQQKVGQLIVEALSEVFQKYGSEYYGSAFVTITDVWLSPDLLLAKIYLSIYNVENKQEHLDRISFHSSGIRKRLGIKLRNNLRRIPELHFELDDTLDKALRVDELLKKGTPDSD